MAYSSARVYDFDSRQEGYFYNLRHNFVAESMPDREKRSMLKSFTCSL